MVCEMDGGKIRAITYGKPRKYNSFPRFYACIYRRATKKWLEANGKRKCWLPVIKAEEIEEMVWDELLQILTYGGFDQDQPSKLQEQLVDKANYDENMRELTTIKENFERELHGTKNARELLFSSLKTLDRDKFDKEEFYSRLEKYDVEIRGLNSKLADINKKIADLQEAKANSDEFIEFVKENPEWLQEIRQELNNLEPADKKRLAENLIDGKITVWLGNLEEGEEGPPWNINFKFSFNRAILDALAAEGKLPSLSRNSRISTILN